LGQEIVDPGADRALLRAVGRGCAFADLVADQLMGAFDFPDSTGLQVGGF
jgi:hypothetical protein